ncbi:hypothetical protein GYB22_13005 [bacterium]|nr:hypothetical protein [bacterium]
MEYIVVVLGILVMAVAVAGTVLPGLPGPILAYGALILVWFNPHARANIADSFYLWPIVLLALTGLVYVMSKKLKNKTASGTYGRVPAAANIQILNILAIATYFVIILV